jgi:hypothetical protein
VEVSLRLSTNIAQMFVANHVQALATLVLTALSTPMEASSAKASRANLSTVTFLQDVVELATLANPHV